MSAVATVIADFMLRYIKEDAERAADARKLYVDAAKKKLAEKESRSMADMDDGR